MGCWCSGGFSRAAKAATFGFCSIGKTMAPNVRIVSTLRRVVSIHTQSLCLAIALAMPDDDPSLPWLSKQGTVLVNRGLYVARSSDMRQLGKLPESGPLPGYESAVERYRGGNGIYKATVSRLVYT